MTILADTPAAKRVKESARIILAAFGSKMNIADAKTLPARSYSVKVSSFSETPPVATAPRWR